MQEANQFVLLKRQRMWFIIPYRQFGSPEERKSFVEDTSRRIKAPAGETKRWPPRCSPTAYWIFRRAAIG